MAGPRSRGVLSGHGAWALAAVLVTPAIGLGVLLAAPSADGHWDHQPSHFWLVLGAGAVAALLAWSIGTSARRRTDGRLFLVSLSFSAAAAWLGLHALATPEVLVSGRSTGFEVAVPVGLLVASGFAVWSACPLDGAPARWVVAHSGALRLVLSAAVAVWAATSVADLPPLDDPFGAEAGSPVMLLLGIPAAAGFAVAAWRYLALARQRQAALLVAVASAWVLLAEAAVAAAITDTWRGSWWLWHGLMGAAFGAIAVAATRLPDQERFSDLYLDEVAGGTREVTVLFADLAGFTTFSEQNEPEVVRAMLNTYFEAVLPPIRAAGGRVDRLMGDAVMVTFNVAATQPDHATRAVRAALDLQAAAAAVAAREPTWPRFRVGVNTGPAVVGVVGDAGHRDYTVLGDSVNVASRIESLAPTGGIAISDTTRRAAFEGGTEGAVLASLGTVTVKHRVEPLEIWRLDAAPSPLES